MDRNIFEYSNGDKKVKGDPITLRRRTQQLALQMGSRLGALIEKANPVIVGGPAVAKASDIELNEAWNALEKLEAIAREAFDLVAFDKESGKGATAEHALAVLDHFHEFLQKKNPMQDSNSTSTQSAEFTSAT